MDQAIFIILNDQEGVNLTPQQFFQFYGFFLILYAIHISLTLLL